MKLSQFKSVVSGVPQVCVFGSSFFILYTPDVSNNFEYKIVSYADDTTSYSEDTSPSNYINCANSLKIRSWCSSYEIKHNSNKTHSFIYYISKYTFYFTHL